MQFESTIAAPITASGMSAVAVVRISGDLTRYVIEKVCVRYQQIIESPRSMVYTPVVDCKSDNSVFDYALVCFFPAPNSYTGEDCAEFSLHGSEFVVSHFLEVLSSLNVSMACRGEFSRRAFLNGKLDLVQAEAVSDLIASESKMQAQVALNQLQGKLTDALLSLGDPLWNVLAEIEAYIDFPDEDITGSSRVLWSDAISGVVSILDKYIHSYKFGKLYKQGAKVSIVGLANAGKSSLLNALLGESRVIVSPIAGTTRDSVEEKIVIDGLSVCLSDTAGLAHVDGVDSNLDEIESMGVKLSWKRIKEADLVVYVMDALVAKLESELKLINRVMNESVHVIGVGNKSDLLEAYNKKEIFCDDLGFKVPLILVSAKTGEGLLELKKVIRQTLISNDCSSNQVLITTQRHVDALKKAREFLAGVLGMVTDEKIPLEIISVEIRSTLSALEEIVGVTCSEDLLGRIFERFCIGK